MFKQNNLTRIYKTKNNNYGWLAEVKIKFSGGLLIIVIKHYKVIKIQILLHL